MDDVRQASTRRDLMASGAAMIAAASLPRASSAQTPALRGPVDVERRRALVGRPLLNFSCGAPPPPVRDLEVEGAYIDPAYSIIDPAKLKAMQEATKPVGQYSIKVAQLSDAWLMSRPAKAEPAQYALAWLDAWASGDALLGRLNTADSQHQRRWTLCGLALAYQKIRNAPGLDDAARHRVERWFTRMSDAATAYYGKWPRDAYTNHIFWWALALASTGVATGDRATLDHGITIYRAALEEIQPNGSLPLEMKRRERAYGYHVFALAPLVMIAEIGEANGLGLYAEKGGALHRLADRVLAGVGDPAWFAARAGAAQEGDNKPNAFTFVWAEPYYARFPNPALGRQIAEHRPLFNHWLGGSTTYGFGSTALPFPRS